MGRPACARCTASCYRRLRGIYRFALADAHVESPDADGKAALRRSAQLADMDPEHLRAVSDLAAAPIDETERGLVEVSMISQILPLDVLDWCSDRQSYGRAT